MENKNISKEEQAIRDFVSAFDPNLLKNYNLDWVKERSAREIYQYIFDTLLRCVTVDGKKIFFINKTLYGIYSEYGSRLVHHSMDVSLEVFNESVDKLVPNACRLNAGGVIIISDTKIDSMSLMLHLFNCRSIVKNELDSGCGAYHILLKKLCLAHGYLNCRTNFRRRDALPQLKPMSDFRLPDGDKDLDSRELNYKDFGISPMEAAKRQGLLRVNLWVELLARARRQYPSRDGWFPVPREYITIKEDGPVGLLTATVDGHLRPEVQSYFDVIGLKSVQVRKSPVADDVTECRFELVEEK